MLQLQLLFILFFFFQFFAPTTVFATVPTIFPGFVAAALAADPVVVAAALAVDLVVGPVGSAVVVRTTS